MLLLAINLNPSKNGLIMIHLKVGLGQWGKCFSLKPYVCAVK